MQAPNFRRRRPNIRSLLFLLSHLPVDHLLGLGMYPRLSQKEVEMTICVLSEDDPSAQALDSLYAPPYWPLKLEDCGGRLQILPHSFPFQIGEISKSGLKGCHPGGVWCFRLEYRGKTLVYASVFEHEEPYFCDFIDFSRNADLILYDAQYTEEEYEREKGYGHSAAEKRMELLESSGAGQLLLIQHDPWNTAGQLLEHEAQIGKVNVLRYAREGEVIPV